MIMMRMAVLKNTKTFVALLSRLLLLSAAAVDVSAQTTPPVVRYMCDNCIDRSKYTVRAIVHGTKDDPYWQQLQASAVQAAKDMQVGLEMTLYDPQSSAEAIATQMAEDIQAAIDANPRPNGLIVSIPFEEVASAVQQAVAAGIPVFGVNGDSVTGADTGVLDFIASDHKIGGTLAAEEMIKSGASSNFLFVNYQGEGNFINAERYAGFSQAIQGSNETTAPVDVNEIVVDANADAAVIQEALVTAMTSSTSSSCPAVLLSGKNILQSAIAAHAEAGCSSLITTTSPLGTFETSQEVYNAIDAGQLSFAVAEQQALQGSLAMILAALYVTTGKTLSASTEVEGGAYLTGPIIINKNTTMSDSQKTCEVDAFPICPNNKVSSRRTCRESVLDRNFWAKLLLERWLWNLTRQLFLCYLFFIHHPGTGWKYDFKM